MDQTKVQLVEVRQLENCNQVAMLNKMYLYFEFDLKRSNSHNFATKKIEVLPENVCM